MAPGEVINALWVWTPFLAAGFVVNLMVSVLAMFIGTPIGWFLAKLRLARSSRVEWIGAATTGLARSIPSLVFLFYLAFVIPVEFPWNGEIIKVPPWFKATIALSVPVIGFTSDNILELIRQRGSNVGSPWLRFGVAYIQYFLIIIMASSTASVIGANEIVGRANTVIAALDAPDMMLWTYLYVSLWFLVSGFLVWSLATYLLARFEADDEDGSDLPKAVDASTSA